MTTICKNNIIFGGTIVKFRNGYLGIALENKSLYGHDGDEVFIVYDSEKKQFICQKRLCTFDEDLRCMLSGKVIDKYFEEVFEGKKSGLLYGDRDWDVIKMKSYADATIYDVFKKLYESF